MPGDDDLTEVVPCCVYGCSSEARSSD